VGGSVDPPLKPEFQVCAGGALVGRLPAGTDHLAVPFSFSVNP
jgi:hypothetical protein